MKFKAKFKIKVNFIRNEYTKGKWYKAVFDTQDFIVGADSVKASYEIYPNVFIEGKPNIAELRAKIVKNKGYIPSYEIVSVNVQ